MPSRQRPGGRGNGSGGGGGNSLKVGWYRRSDGSIQYWNGKSWSSQGPGSGASGGSSGGSSGGGSSGGGGGAGFSFKTITGRNLSQAQVDALKSDFRHIGQMYGVALGAGALTHLVKMDLSSQEVLQRVQVIQKLNENQTFFTQFGHTLIAKGLAKGPLTREEERQFVLGTAPAKFYNAWEGASVRTGLVESGLRIGRPAFGGDLTVGQKFVNTLMDTLGRDKILSGSATVNETYAKIAKDLLDVLPESRYQDFGLGKRDFIELEAGGPHSLSLAAKVRQLQANAAARAQGQAQPVFPNPQQDTGYTSQTA